MKKFVARMLMVTMSMVGLVPANAEVVVTPKAAATAPLALDAEELAALNAAEIAAAGLDLTAAGGEVDDDEWDAATLLYLVATIVVMYYGIDALFPDGF